MHWLYRFLFICLLDLGVLAHVRLAELNYGSTPDYELNYRSTPDYERYCPPEDFEHSYLSNGENNSLIKETHVNHFRRTQIGKNATMRDLCLDSSGLPVQRQCEDYYGSAIWKPLDNISCNAGNNLSWGLNQLHEELLRGDDDQIILTRLQHSLSEARGQLTPVDVYITAQICNSFVEKERYYEALGTNLISICSEIMNINETVLELSAKVNATNVLLVNFDKYMDAISEQFVSEERCGNVFMSASSKFNEANVELHNYIHIGVQALISRNLSVFYLNPSCYNITGLAIYSVAGPDRISTSKDFWFRFVYANESIENLKLESDLETAVYITDSEYVSRLLINDLPYVVFKIYENDALFLDDSEEHKKRFRSKVLSGKLLGDHDTQRNYSMQLLLRKPKELDVQCRRWDNHHWKYYGVYDSMDSSIPEDYVLCVGYEWPMGTNVRIQWKSIKNNIEYCAAEDFEHTYKIKSENGSLSTELHINHFRRTNLNTLATMKDLCLDSSGLPVHRLCEDNNGTAIWEPLDNISCNAGNNLSWGLNQLYDNIFRGDDVQVILTRLQHSLIEARGQLTPVDVYITAQIFTTFVEQKIYYKALGLNWISICSEVMNSNETVLEVSAKVNATNALLDSFDKYMDAISEQFLSVERCGNVFINVLRESNGANVQLHNYSDIGVLALISRNLSVFYVSPSCSNITGLAIYSAAGPDRISTSKDFWFRFVYANESIENIMLESYLETAVYMTDKFMSQLVGIDLPYVVLKIYENDALFMNYSLERKRRVRSKVISGKLLEDHGTQRPYGMQLLLRKPKELAGACRQWDNDHWQYEGVTTRNDTNVSEDYVLCIGYEWPMGTNVQLQWESHEKNTKENSSEYCAAEDFEHTYKIKSENGSLSTETHVNHFKKTSLNTLATMEDLCLDNNGLPVHRLCENKNGIATWGPLQNVSCLAGNNISQELNQLHEDLFSGRQSQEVILAQVGQSVGQAQGQLEAVDVYNTANIFGLLDASKPNSTAMGANLVSVCNEMMKINETVLRLSARLNATNVLLDNFEQNMDALSEYLVHDESCGKVIEEAARESAEAGVKLINKADIGVQALISSKLSVFYVNPECNNITGMAIYSDASPDHTSSSGKLSYRFLYANESAERLKKEPRLETAAYMPGHLWRQLRHKGASYFVLKVYANDALFVETSMQSRPRPDVKVLSITIPGYDDKLPNPVQFLLRKPKQVGVVCAYWNYTTWNESGITTGSNMFDDIVLCEADHLTQFTALVGVDLPEPHKIILSVLTYLGCGLSLFGMLGIFLTAMLVSKWREQASTKVLLHLCLALSLQLSLFLYFTSGHWSIQENSIRCLISGALLQYSVLVVFSWMLIISMLQFQRYVTILGVDRPRHYILISAIVAWTLPLVPTLLIVFLDRTSYKPTQDAFCYPTGNGLLLGVVLPIALVTIANAFMMIRIVYSVNQALRSRRKLIFQQMRLFVLLFFLLGISWIFGLSSYLFSQFIIFSYLFCITATLQGLVLFLYFVIFNATHRQAWLKFICPKLVKVDAPKDKTHIQSTTFSISSSKKNAVKVN